MTAILVITLMLWVVIAIGGILASPAEKNSQAMLFFFSAMLVLTLVSLIGVFT